MITIDKATSLKDLALIVCGKLREHGIKAVLTGGAVVSIYTDNKYQSYDLDFISHAKTEDISRALKEIGFLREGRYYRNPSTDFFVEFPAPPIAVGNKPLFEFNEISSEVGYLILLSPTQCVMDRLAAFFHWNDPQSLEQAILVSLNHTISFQEVYEWTIEERCEEKYDEFLRRLKQRKIETEGRGR
jgi:hypothetical protein